MSRNRRLLLKVILGFLIFTVAIPANASTLDNKKNELSQIQNQIKTLENGLREKKSKINTLNDQIAYFDTEISTVTEEIDLTISQINKLQSEIKSLNAEIKKTEKKLKEAQELLKDYLTEIYSQGKTSALEMIVSSNNISEYMNQMEYTETLQEKVNNQVTTIKDIKANLDKNKSRAEQENKKLNETKTQLTAKKTSLDNTKAEKQKLLDMTFGEEQRFQDLLTASRNKEAAAEREIQNIVSSLYNRGSTSGGQVSTGAIIGYQGNTGYSTGTHLHFTVFKNGVAVDPLPLLNNGTFNWPLSGFIITQYYGKPNWNAAYSFHNGIDLSAGYGAPIHAAAPGTVVTDGWMPNGYGHYKVVDHGNGYMTLYGHMKQ
ncbi:hypothetical protein AUK11_01000 [bacterium CG2_30_37_16]|nr:MAG: hypothetical protein AUK11_01000 [bacterium CG2_30_37_16]PIP31092.1 MAG: hypothetical protein COX25_01215 [bacterium (Candidatus Howlettbacteria) CG23_combo_of_CG06-09_8_20_14_all_37_9]PIX98919.1 MAG: hypothetical protein COZ22_03870 [bacterium (Candidatus Howlettbacteria) CG_4_10_14_3_um_filter_37_10]PJB05796.1 MAG: hypothetical protein CO123_03380 [bacterium (Candidatus Howlettbacteria) CG_4_9_14_3_um_filter_37_10]